MTGVGEAMQARMVALILEMDRVHDIPGVHYATWAEPYFTEASAIVALLPKPVDPDLQVARDVVAMRPDNEYHRASIMSGEWDDGVSVTIAYAAIKRGRELAALSPQDAADSAAGWNEWSGGDCPVPDGKMVEIRDRAGRTDIGDAGSWDWDRDPSDIIAYRVVQS